MFAYCLGVEAKPGTLATMWRLDPPLEDDRFAELIRHVVVNSVNANHVQETLVFPANERGEVLVWDEITGVEGLDQKTAFDKLGYTVVE